MLTGALIVSLIALAVPLLQRIRIVTRESGKKLEILLGELAFILLLLAIVLFGGGLVLIGIS